MSGERTPEICVASPERVATVDFIVLAEEIPISTAEVRELLSSWFPKKPQQKAMHSLNSEIFHLQKERRHMTTNICKIFLQLSSVINELSQCGEEERHQERQERVMGR